MKGIKKTLCLLLSLVMILSMGVPAFAFDNATSEAQANTTSSETSPFSIELSTDKSSYSATGIAKITAKVTNTSGKDIKNVSAEAVFGELAPCKKKSSQTTAEAETLKDGESLEFTYSATINKNAKKLNIFEKIILFFVRLFNGGYSAKDNGFDDGREFVESSNDMKFGKRWARNTVKVWFGESGETPDNPPTQDKSYEELIKDVDIDEIPYGDYNVVSDEETGRKYVNNIIVIDFDLDCTDKRKAEIINSINGTVIGGIGDDCLVIEIAPCSYMDLEKICDELNSNNSDIWTYFEEPYGLSVSGMPNDPWLDSNGLGLVDWNNANLMYDNWWATAIELRNAWGYDEYFNDINIGIADVGFSNSHEDLKINIVSEENSPDNHGTHVAGIIGATHNNGKGIAGVVNKANMYGYDLQNANGKFNNTLFKTAQHEALKCLVEDYKCKIINFSVGQFAYINNNKYYTDKDFTNEITDEKIYDWGHTASKWICKLLEKGFDFIVVQAAGNGAKNTDLGIDKKYNGTFASISEGNCYSSKNISIDKILSRVITVSAATISDNNNTYQLTDFSNGNASIAAPGFSIFSTVAGIPDSYVSQGQKYASMPGTSMSSPIVAGIAGLVWSINKNFSGAIVRDIVCNAFYLDEWVYDNPKSTDISGNNRMVNAKLAVEEAIKKTYWAGTVTGKVVDIIPDEPKPLSNINITATEKNTNKTVYGKTNADGTFSLVLPAGNYNIIFSKGASEIELEDIAVTYNSYSDLGIIKMMIPVARIQGVVKDNKTKEPISGVKINVADNYLPKNKCWIDNDISTDENGCFYIELSCSDDCTFEFICDKYSEYTLNNVDCSDTYVDLGDIFLTLEDDNGDGDDGDNDRPVTASGDCGANGDNVRWVLYDDGELKISGQGEMKNFTSRSSSPWYKYAYSTIKKVIIKHGITSIGDYSFDNCRNLTHITLPNTITQIGKLCFRDCGKLTSIEIPESVKSIGERCFFRCDSLATINIPYSITNIGYYAFDECENLEYINVDVDNQNYCSLDGVLFNKNKTELFNIQ